MADAYVGPSLNRVALTVGKDVVVAEIISMIEKANRMSGEGLGGAAVVDCAEMIFDRWKNRTITSLRMAFFRGMNKGKIYGKLTYPVMAEWLNDMVDSIEEYSYNQHMSRK